MADVIYPHADFAVFSEGESDRKVYWTADDDGAGLWPGTRACSSRDGEVPMPFGGGSIPLGAPPMSGFAAYTPESGWVPATQEDTDLAESSWSPMS